MPKTVATRRRQNLHRRPGFLQALRAARTNIAPLQQKQPSERPASPTLAAYPSFADLLPPEVLALRQPRPDTPPPSPPRSLLSEQLAKMAIDESPLRSSAPSPQP